MAAVHPEGPEPMITSFLVSDAVMVFVPDAALIRRPSFHPIRSHHWHP
jgi:hypothetical protein